MDQLPEIEIPWCFIVSVFFYFLMAVFWPFASIIYQVGLALLDAMDCITWPTRSL